MPRPKGRRNNATLMKEEVVSRLTRQAQGFLIHEVRAVLETVVQKAKEGDMTAAKLVLDRAIPVKRSTEELAGKPVITINITGDTTLEAHSHGEDSRQGEAVGGEPDSAGWSDPVADQSRVALPEPGGEAGPEPHAKPARAGLKTH